MQNGETPNVEAQLSEEKVASIRRHRRDFGFLPIPPWCRVDATGEPARPFGYSKALAFACASTFSTSFGFGLFILEHFNSAAVMNLYYNQPILLQLAREFNVDDVGVSRIPVLLQAGYAGGLLLLSPLGDLVRRRPFLLLLIFTSGSLTIGLAVTRSLVVFEVLSFLVALSSVTPQVLIPLTADLAPPNRRATMMAIVFSGLLMGVLLARVLSGIITQFSSYRNVFWMGTGGQYLLLILLYFITPDMPAKNPDLTYWKILQTMAKYAVTEPALIQGCLVFFFNSAIFAGFWVTMTFLLDGAPYHYSTLVIGLFGLVGMAGISMSPVTGRLVDGFVPWMGILLGILLVIVSQVIQTFTGQLSVGAVIIATIVLDLGAQSTQVAVLAGVLSIAPEARARLNALLIFSIFLGQVMGTAVGTKLFASGGYKLSSGVRVAFGGAELLLLLIRGPHVGRKTWIGWQGGMHFRKREEREAKKNVESVQQPQVVSKSIN
ncbi:MFS DHA1 protein [Mycena maculata]|uniref:MFS DHA1 protein n=1 Tax=Mycena maculata TaxID=230809 RepID=A0AAD7MMS6_9AGAR|nr:MFS DHA1 protein [Mycena maculata]